MDFGLGLILSFTDNATAGINNAVNSLNSLTQIAEGASQSLNQMASLSALSVISGQLGNSFLKAGKGIMGFFSDVLAQTRNIGQEFENFDVTLTALFGGAEVGAKKSQDALNRLFEFAKNSPLEVGSVKDMIVTLQSQGINAFEKATGAITGTRQEFLAFITDLKSFKPEVSDTRFKMAIQNYIGSGEKRMMRTVFDMGDIEQILGHEMGSTAEERMNDIIEMVEKKGLTGLSKSMTKTWTGVASNISDAFTQIYYSIASNGVFERLKEAFVGVANTIILLNPERLQALGSTIADGLNIIVTPLTFVAKKLEGFIKSIIDLCETNPELVKLGMTLLAVFGGLLIVIGVILKATSAFSGLSLILLAMGESFTTIGSVIKVGAMKMLSTLLPLIATIGLLSIAWKNDLAGIRTNVTYFVSNLSNSFKTAKQAVSGSVADLTNKLAELKSKDDFFSNLTIGMMKVMMVGKALSDAWGDYTLSEDNFLKAEELGILPLIEAVLDLKYRFEHFKEGFIAGWQEVSTAVSDFVRGLASSLDGTIFDSMLDGVTNLLEALSNNDPKAWKDFGKIVGDLSAKFLLAFTALKLFSSVSGKIVGIITLFSKLSSIIGGIKGIGGSIGSFFAKLFPSLHGIVEKGLKTIFKSNIDGIIPNIRIWFAGVKDAFISAITGIASALGAPVWAVVAVIIAILATVITYAVTHWEEFKEKILSIWTTVKDKATEIWESIKDGLSRIWENLKEAVKPVVDSFNNLKDKFIEAKDELGKSAVIQSLIDILSAIGETIINIIVPAIKGLLDKFTKIFKAIWNVVVTVFNAIVNIISSVLSNVMDIISGVLDIIVGLFTGNLDRVFQGVGTVFTAILDVISTILQSVWNVIMSVLSGILNFFGSTLTSIVNVVSGAFQGILSFVGSILDSVFKVVSSIWDSIKTKVDTVVSNLSDGVKEKWETIKSTITEAIEGARDKVKTAIEKIKSFFNFEWKLPDLKTPHFTITGDFSLSPPSVPKIGVSWYEKGGVFDKPSVIGVGENGREAVMPLEKNVGWINELAGMLTTSMQTIRPINSNQYNTTNQGGSHSYLTNNNTNNQSYYGDTDNSVVFNQGAIQVTVQNASEEEAIKLAKKVMLYIRRQKELDKIYKYA